MSGQYIKYVGPKDEKQFHGFIFQRDVTDEGVNAQEVPNEVAIPALKARDTDGNPVFLQKTRPVSDKVKALRPALAEALEAEGRRHHEHFAKRKVVAELTITADNETKAEMLAKEIAGADAEMEHGLGLIRQAEELRARIAEERGEAPAPVLPQASSEAEKSLLALVLSMKEEIEKLKAGQAPTNPQLAAELQSIQTSIQEEIDKDLAKLKLPAPVLKALEEDGLTQVVQLAGESRETLLQIKGIGPAAVEAIQAALVAHGLSLVGEGSQPPAGQAPTNPQPAAGEGSTTDPGASQGTGTGDPA